MRRTVASSGAHRPHPSLREHPPRCLAHTPHAPALVPPVVDHLPCRGGVSLRSRSACAAQQGRPTPSSPEEKQEDCERRKNFTEGATDSISKLLVPNLTAPPAVQAGKQHAPCAATSPRNWFTSLATSKISVPKVLTQVNSGTVFDHAQGLKSDGTQELRIIGCVIIANRHRNGRSPRQRRAHPEPGRSTRE